MIIHLIAAARPNFMKIAPLYHALKRETWATPLIVHTGQHYDSNMSAVFFNDLGLPIPDFHLGVGSGTHAVQTAQVMIEYEKIIIANPPDLIVVVGDVNSTMAAAIVASKLGIKVAHLEAGLRSFDRSMPEEINRVVTDALADLLWTPSPDADDILIHEGIPERKICRVGNIMMDSLELLRDRIQDMFVYKEEFGFQPGGYGVVTLHRPSNVDGRESLHQICRVLGEIAKAIPLIFSLHPRTKRNLEKNGLLPGLAKTVNIFLIEPQTYIRFMNLIFNSRLVITDSGGLQEETTYLGIPCLTLRPNTERPITVLQGTNQLCRFSDIEDRVHEILDGKFKRHSIPEFWDGKTASRVVDSIRFNFGINSSCA